MFFLHVMTSTSAISTSEFSCTNRYEFTIKCSQNMQATATRFPLNVDAQDSPTISKSTFDFYVLAAGCKQVGFHLLCHTSEQYVFLANCFKTISSDSTPVGQLPKWRLFQGLRCKVISSAAHLKRVRPLMVGDCYFSF